MDKEKDIENINSLITQFDVIEQVSGSLSDRDFKIRDYLNDLSFKLEWERIHYDLKQLTAFAKNPSYKEVSYDFPSISSYIHERGFFAGIFAVINDRYNWKISCSPSFPSGIMSLCHNIKEFFSYHFNPWYCIHCAFVKFFSNENGSKLLNDGTSWCYIRNRISDCAYYYLKFTGCHYKLVKMQVLKDEQPVNIFMENICNIGKTDSEMKKEETHYKEVKETIASGWVFGWKSFVREMDKIVKLTPDLEWIKY